MDLLYSLRLALRSLKRRPAFSSIVVLTIAIVTGTSIVVFSYVDALLFKSLPFSEPDRLVRIQSVKGDEKGYLSYPEFLDMQKELVGISELAAYRSGGRYNLSGDGQPPEDLTTTFATSNFFKVLGIDPILGDHWPATLDEKGSHTVMLTHEFWKRRYGGDENVAGIEITLDGFSYQNYGVLPEGFSFPDRIEAFRALAFADFVVGARDFRSAIGLARLKPGVSLTEFNQELNDYAVELQERHLESNGGVLFVAEPLSDLFIGEINGYLILLWVATLLLIIIAAINISNLIVSQALRQGRETTVRRVLGSSKSMIIRDAVFKTLVLSFAGSLAGLAFSRFLLNITYDLVAEHLPYWVDVGINYSVLLYALLIAVILGIVTGMAPWLFHLSGNKLVDRLKEGQQTVGNKKQLSLQRRFAMVQILASVLLVVGGGLLYKSFAEAQSSQLGFETQDKLTFRIALSWFKYGGKEKKRNFFEKSLRSIEAIPGVQRVAMNSALPLTERAETSVESQSMFSVEGQSEVAQTQNPFVSVQRITSNYFEVMDIEMMLGRSFDETDINSHEFQVVIDQQLAERMWPAEPSIGKRIQLERRGDDSPFLTIVGVADNVKHQSITGENIPIVYTSLLANAYTDAHYIIETDSPLSELAPKLSDAILAIDENQPTFEYLPMANHIEQENWQSKVSSLLFLSIAIIGSLIAAVGLFSIITFMLVLRVKELALRRVLGAGGNNIIRLVMKDVLMIAGVGTVAGLLLAPFALKPLAPFLFEVDLVDFSIYSFALVGMLLVAVLATLSPMWKALFINPVEVLRTG
ncbi:MAG: ABC transporter permease [Bacteroidota bacterium]